MVCDDCQLKATSVDQLILKCLYVAGHVHLYERWVLPSTLLSVDTPEIFSAVLQKMALHAA